MELNWGRSSQTEGEVWSCLRVNFHKILSLFFLWRVCRHELAIGAVDFIVSRVMGFSQVFFCLFSL